MNMQTSLRLLNLTSTNINGSNLNIDTSVNLRNGLFNINSNNRIGILKVNPNYTLDIIGDINLTGNIYNNGIIVTTEPASTSLWSNNSGFIFYNGGGVSIGYSSNPAPYSFYVNGTSYFVSDVTINSNLIVDSDIDCNNIIVTDTTTTTNLIVTDTTNVKGLTSSLPIDTNGLTISAGDLEITSGDIIAPGSTITCLNLYSTNQNTFTANTTFEENVSVLGQINCEGNFNVNNRFLVNASSGNINLTGSATIGNSLSVASTLNVSGFSELSKVKINNDLTINGNLYVETGSTILDNLTVDNDTIINNNLSVDSNNFIVNTSTNQVQINYVTQSISNSTGALVVDGGVGIGENLYVNNKIVSKNGVSEFIDVTIDDVLIVNGGSTFNTSTNTFGNSTVYGNIICEATGGTIGGKIIGESGLQIGYVSSPNGPALTVDSTGNLNTYGNVNIEQNLTVAGNILVEGNFTISGSAGNFSGGIITNSRFIQDTSATYNIYTTYSGSNFVFIQHNVLQTIYLPLIDTLGAYYKFIVGPGYTTVGNIVSLEISGSSTMFGLIDNAGTYTSFSGDTTIYFNNNSQGDFIEVTVVLTSATGDYSYYINAKSSNTNGFLSS
jgi:hypothetical protein